MRKGRRAFFVFCLFLLIATGAALLPAGYGETRAAENGCPVPETLEAGPELSSYSQNAVTRGLFRKAPYLIYPGTSTDMQVIWQLDSTATCEIAWGIDPSYPSGVAETVEYGDDHQHSYTIPDLTPGERYFYRVTAGDENEWGMFRAAPAAETSRIGFIAYGDTRSNPAVHDSVAAGMISFILEHPLFHTFVLSVGDLVYNGNRETDWDNQFFDPAYPFIQAILANAPYQTARGNHDGSGTLFGKYFPYPFAGGTYWSFDYGPAHFTVIDQYTPGPEQLVWIANDLATTDKPWKFIVLHEPGWSAGGHGNDEDVQTYIQPLCEEYGVTIVFAGHNHYYARAVVNGVHHVTTGGGGAPLYQPNPGYPNVVASSKSYHFCTVEIDGNIIEFDAMKPDGEIIDSFTGYLDPLFTGGEGHAVPVVLSFSP